MSRFASETHNRKFFHWIDHGGFVLRWRDPSMAYGERKLLYYQRARSFSSDSDMVLLRDYVASLATGGAVYWGADECNARVICYSKPLTPKQERAIRDGIKSVPQARRKMGEL